MSHHEEAAANSTPANWLALAAPEIVNLPTDIVSTGPANGLAQARQLGEAIARLLPMLRARMPQEEPGSFLDALLHQVAMMDRNRLESGSEEHIAAVANISLVQEHILERERANAQGSDAQSIAGTQGRRVIPFFHPPPLQPSGEQAAGGSKNDDSHA